MDGILALDGGGTKCEALLADVSGESLAFSRVQPRHRNGSGQIGNGRSAETVQEAADLALGRWGGVFETLHLTGCSGVMTFQMRARLPARRVVLWLTTEWEAALAAADLAEGVVAMAGTGAFGHLRLGGRNWHGDGFGPLMGDRGSGYAIGRACLRAAIRADSAPRHATALRAAVARELAWSGKPEGLAGALIHEGLRVLADRTAVARYAVVVEAEARAGDAIAVGILEQAADGMAETVRDLVETAGARDARTALVGAGSVIVKSDLYWARLCARLHEWLPGVQPVRVAVPMVAGMVLHVLAAEGQGGPGAADRLKRTLPVAMKGVA